VTVAVAAALTVLAGAACAQTPLKVIVFPGLSNLAQFAAQSQGYYKKRGLDVELINTPNSNELREGLAAGRYQIAHGGVDNAVSQVEVNKVDLFIFMGGNNGMNDLFVQPEIKSYADLRGKTLAVDAPDTAFALLMYKMLAVNGVKRGEYQVKAFGATQQRYQAMLNDKGNAAAAILGLPLSIEAKKSRLKDMGTAVSVVGPYQSDGGWVLRSWGEAHKDTLVRYIQANIEGIRWALKPANKAALTALVTDKVKLSQDVVAQSLDAAFAEKGYATDAKFDMEGFKNALKLRADMLGTWGGTPPPPDKYLDLSYYETALKGL
jgi:ABC-type nitrate/sulfonate/bicarbonate transport system substrate-binding protein